MNPSNEPKHIVAKPIHPQRTKKSGLNNNRRIWARVCYYYPQYTLEQASKLSYRDIMLLLNTARRIEAERNLTLTQMLAAPHTEKGKGVKDLTKYFEQEADK